MQQTTNYALKKPDGTDTVDISVLNGNMDTIDNELGKRAPNGYGLGGKANRLPDGTDLNGVIANGWYDVHNAVNGIGLEWIKIFVIDSGDDSYTTQLAFTLTDGSNKMYMRQKTAGTWGNWQQVAKISDIPTSLPASGGNSDTVGGKHATDFAPSGYGLGTMAVDISNQDLNNYNTTGFFRGSSMANAPNADWYYVEIFGHDGSYTLQIATNFFNNNMYYRRKANGTWQSWARIANISDIPSIPSSLPANGGNSSTVGGFSASGTPSTTEKSNLVGMINELFTSGTNGKNDIYNAISAKGTTPASKNFGDLVSAIGNISTGKKFAKGTGVANSNGIVTVTGLAFSPSIIVCTYVFNYDQYRYAYFKDYNFVYSQYFTDEGYCNSDTNNTGIFCDSLSDKAAGGIAACPLISINNKWLIYTNGFITLQMNSSTSQNVNWMAVE